MDHDLYLFAEEANDELAALKEKYYDLLLRYDALLEKTRRLEGTLDRALSVCANLTKAMEKRYVQP